ncbi:conserved membrane protein [Mycobacterium tuberculosis T17]|nr:conserved membrane protein [Mycobacterium tuberculosis T17]
MGFLQPGLPDIDLAEWSQGSRSQKIRPMAQHWAEVGFGTPVLLHLFYVAKILLYVLVGWLIVLTTKGIDGFTDAAAWYAEPIVFEKVVLYTMLFEVIGLGCGFGPLNNRFFPPMGSILYWMRFGTIRLPPWPDRVPWTRGTKRKPVDVALYALLVMMLLSALFTDGAGPIPELGTTVGLLPAWQIVLILLLLGVLGLRDKVIFLAARGEVYATLTVTFLFGRLNGIDMIVAAKLVFLVIWIGAATSKLNRHFPFVISTMMSNNPLFRPRFIKRMFFKKFPGDLRPGLLSRIVAHVSTVIEMCVPVVLFVAHGGWPTVVAATIMVCFHLGILTAVPMGVPLEWNVFMISASCRCRRPRLPRVSGREKPGAAGDPDRRCRGNRHCGQRVSPQDLVSSRHALLRRQLGYHAVVHQALRGGQDQPGHRRDRQHAGRSAGALLRQGPSPDPDVSGIRVSCDELPWQGAIYAGASGDGRP